MITATTTKENTVSKPDRNIDRNEFTPDERGIPTATWAKLGFTDKADPRDVELVFAGHQGPVAIGLVRMWMHASEKQQHSKEYQDTFDAVNDDLCGERTPNVFPRADYPVRG